MVEGTDGDRIHVSGYADHEREHVTVMLKQIVPEGQIILDDDPAVSGEYERGASASFDIETARETGDAFHEMADWAEEARENRLGPALETDDAVGSDYGCADCGESHLLWGPFDFDGNLVEDGDFVCEPCAESRGYEGPFEEGIRP